MRGGGGLGFAAAYRRLGRFPGQELGPKERRLLCRGGFVFQESVVRTNAGTPTQAVASKGRWPHARAAATCPLTPYRSLELKARPLEEPQRVRCCWSGRPARRLRTRGGEVAGQAGRLSRGPVGAAGAGPVRPDGAAVRVGGEGTGLPGR